MQLVSDMMYIAHKFRIYQSNKNDDYTSSYDNIKDYTNM